MRQNLALSEEQVARFSHLLEALKYGCPPHGGLALGFDRMLALLCGKLSVFPAAKFSVCLIALIISEHIRYPHARRGLFEGSDCLPEKRRRKRAAHWRPLSPEQGRARTLRSENCLAFSDQKYAKKYI
jgi:hypothetical protein